MNLARFASLQDPCVFPREMTQGGIAEELGVTRGYVAQELKRLMESGHVVYIKGRVAECNRRMKVYIPTAVGVKEAERLARAVKDAISPRPAVDGGEASLPDRSAGEIPRPDRAGTEWRQDEFGLH